MSWWNNTKRYWLPLLGSLLFLLLVIVFAARLLGPKVGNTFCTMAGCLGSFGIAVEGLPDATSYDIDIQYLRGDEQTLTCEIGEDYVQSSPFINGCVMDGVVFTLDMDEMPPDEVTVTVTANGKKITKVFRPTYEEYYPNGEDCAPVCYTSIVVMDVFE